MIFDIASGNWVVAVPPEAQIPKTTTMYDDIVRQGLNVKLRSKTKVDDDDGIPGLTTH